jgi:hypothetical protein
MPANYETLSFALKRRYTKKKVEDLTLAECPLVAHCTKDTDFSGDSLTVPLIYGNPQGVSGALVDAQAAATNVRGKRFLLTTGTLEASVSFENKVMSATRDNPGAFLRARAIECDGLYTQVGDTLNQYFWGTGGNSLGQIAAGGVAGAVFTLADPSQTVNFEVGMHIVLSANDGTDVGHVQRAGSSPIVAVNREAGTITIADAGDITGEAAGDHIFRRGTFVGATGRFITHGVQSFIYSSSSPPDLYGMIRTDDPQRLAGCRIPAADVAGRSMEERIQILLTRMVGTYKGKGATHGYLNPEEWQILSIELQSRGTRPLKDDTARFGFMYLEVTGGGRVVKIYPDRFCPRGHFFALRQENWTIHSMEQLIQPVDRDGLTILRAATTNDFEYRLVSYPAMSCNAPGWSGRVAV